MVSHQSSRKSDARRVTVVGSGGVGAMAAWRLTAAGHIVTLLDQFTIDHDQGSSYGDSRIVRRVYPRTIYTRMMGEAYGLWARLMVESGDDRLFVQSGGLFFGPAEHPEIHAAASALEDSSVPYEQLDPAECARRFPAVRLESSETALFEPSMGYVRASLAVRAAVQLAESAGCDVRQRIRVAAIEPGAESTRVLLDSGDRIEADSVIVAAGPWSRVLLRPLGMDLPITVTRQPYVHMAPGSQPQLFEQGRFPVWIDAGANAYGFPRLGDIPGVKIGIHDYGDPSAPETVLRTLTDRDRAKARDYGRRRFPLLSGDSCYEKVCLYTVTPDNDFIIDAAPGSPQITVVSACSGHGFKFTPLMGQIAADLAAGGTKIDLQPFRLSRFAGNV